MTSPLARLNPRQVNLLLAIALVGVFTTGLASWAVGTGWSRWLTAAHAIFGYMLLVLAPRKARGSVKPGVKRRNPGWWMSALFGVAITVIIGAGVAHSTGIWTGVGYWSSLWTHFALAFAVIPLVLWHLLSRPVRPRATDVDRRVLLGAAAAGAIAAAAVGGVEAGLRLTGLRGGERRFTGSHEVGSHDPDAMPRVAWIDDTAPRTARADWKLKIDGESADIDALAARTEDLDAILDCTGGWWSEQRWAVVPISAVLTPEGRSFKVTSSTGYSRLFPLSDADTTYLAFGYEDRPLRRGHGGPVRIVAPSRRGPWWIKWVVEVETSDRPWWAQFPFPLT